MSANLDHPSDRESASAAQVRALEKLLIDKGVVSGGTVDKVLGYFESEMAPLNGKRIVARAWTDPDFAHRLDADTAAAVAVDLPLGMAGAEGEHLAAVANGPGVHNLVICTLCSCFPWPVLGLPPCWYKDRCPSPRRPRAARGPHRARGRARRRHRDPGVGRQWALALVRGPAAARGTRHRRPSSSTASTSPG